MTVALHRTDFINVLYQIVALDAAGDELDRSEAVSLMDVPVEDLVGYFKASNTGEDQQFGYSVALSGDGDTLAVGGRHVEDVYVFSRDAAGNWSQQTTLRADYTIFISPSLTLSNDGDTLAIGQPQESSAATGIDGNPEHGCIIEVNNCAEDSGAVFVFNRDEGGWSQQAYIKASNAGASDEFGHRVALSDNGNILAAGAPGEASDHDGVSTNGEGEENNSAFGTGAVYMFERDGGAWSQNAYIKAVNSDAIDYFGSGLALSGNGRSLAVGAYGEDSAENGINGDNQIDDCGDGDTNCARDSGAAYVFVRNSGGWSQQAYIKASNAEDNDQFGFNAAMSGSGDTLAVGALMAETVYTFRRIDGRWSEEAVVREPNGNTSDEFGAVAALSSDGELLFVGASSESGAATGVSMDGPGEESGDSSWAGAVYSFARSDGSWPQQAYIKASNTPAEAFSSYGGRDSFGWSLALSSEGNTLAIGAPWEDSDATGVGGDQGNDNALKAGAVYLY
jgi:hypothetical protein